MIVETGPQVCTLLFTNHLAILLCFSLSKPNTEKRKNCEDSDRGSMWCPEEDTIRASQSINLSSRCPVVLCTMFFGFRVRWSVHFRDKGKGHWLVRPNGSVKYLVYTTTNLRHKWSREDVGKYLQSPGPVSQSLI